MKQSTEAKVETLLNRYPKLRNCEQEILAAIEQMIIAYKNGGRLLVCGNGGSAADSMHIVGELMKGFVLTRTLPEALQEALYNVAPDCAQYLIENLQCALPAVSLVSEAALSTAYANDKAPNLVFAQQVLGQGKKGDVLLVISTSGNSANVLYAAQVAKALGISVIGLTGAGGGKMKKWSDTLIAVPETETFMIQELHLPIYHGICLALEEEFFGGE